MSDRTPSNEEGTDEPVGTEITAELPEGEQTPETSAELTAEEQAPNNSAELPEEEQTSDTSAELPEEEQTPETPMAPTEVDNLTAETNHSATEATYPLDAGTPQTHSKEEEIIRAVLKKIAPLIHEGKIDEAILILKKALEEDPRNKPVYRALLHDLLDEQAHSGKKIEASFANLEIPTIDPEDFEPPATSEIPPKIPNIEKHVLDLIIQVALLHEKGKPDEAIALLRDAKKTDPKNSKHYNKIIKILLSSRETPDKTTKKSRPLKPPLNKREN